VTCPIILAGGVKRGRDILAALALGANAVLLGRPILHGLSVGLNYGVTHVLDIVLSEFIDAMMVTGTGSASAVSYDVIQIGGEREVVRVSCPRYFTM
jgi:(S)-3,5-dihydroxyphenylglycine transaminase